MKMNVFRIFGISLAACLVLALSGCKSPDSPSETKPTGPTVSGVTVSPSNANVNRGGTQAFTAKVNGTGNPAQTVTWTVVGGKAGTGIAVTGLLTVAAGETAPTLTVRATSTVDKSKSGTATVTLTGGIVTVDSVTVNPSSATVNKGDSRQFTAVVTGTNNPAQTVTWAVTGGGAGTGTGIAANGVLTVALDETAETLTVRATSTVDTSKSNTATVTVRTPPLTGAVIITGTAQVGYSLTANTDNLFGSGVISYVWKQADTAQAAGTAITGATARTYEPVIADDGKYITVTVTRAGYSGSITSDAVGPVEPAPANTGSVTGTVTVNNGIDDVTVSFTNTGNLTLLKTGTLTVTVSSSYQAYRWFVDGVALSDETGGSLLLKGADYTIGAHRILVIVYKNGVPYSQEIRFTVS
jgi:hypothetical protein